MTANTFNPYSFPTFDTIFCKLVNYCLLTSTRITYWLSSLIAIERLYVVVFLSGRWLKNPYIARRISFAIVATIFLLSAYELAFIKSEISGGDGSVAVCVMIFPVDDPTWKDLHNSVVIIDSLTPFLIDLISTIDIICIVTKKKMNANAPSVSVSMIKVIAVKDRRFPNVQQTLPTEQAGLNGVGLVAENDQISPKVVTVSAGYIRLITAARSWYSHIHISNHRCALKRHQQRGRRWPLCFGTLSLPWNKNRMKIGGFPGQVTGSQQ
ncbi:unnamed protein product [Rotaria magnacalcarata]|nr:unnamed protein product [Rotaria magnacalcarata]